MFFKTETGSTYEVDLKEKKIRRVLGIDDPTPRQGKDGEWKTFKSLLIEKGEPAYIMWDPKTTPLLEESVGGYPATVTSIVVDIIEDSNIN